MKLIVQIPCLNEEGTIGETIADIPRDIPGVDEVEVLIIDDGSTDGTIEAALAAGADHYISFARNRGLAAAFSAGLEESLRLGADGMVMVRRRFSRPTIESRLRELYEAVV